ncbi:MAG: replication initiator protein A [Clostridiales bacterium]|nr:replication initiator protein A [Clostridiales bacterium]
MNYYFTNENQLTSCMAYPKYLFGTKLSETTKLIYIVLLDKAKMSLKSNNYIDSTGAFIYFPINKMAEAVNKSEMTVKNAYSALEKADLIRRSRQGIGAPNKIYVKLPAADSFVSTKNVSMAQENKVALTKQDNKIRTAYGSQNNVFLTDEEYSALVREFSVVEIEDYIERLSSYMFRRNRKYDSHSETIRDWILDDRQKNNLYN